MAADVVWFLGVSTGSSLIHRALPRWGELLGRPLKCVGVDLPLGADPGAYRRFLADLVAAEEALGAVVTSHKTALYQAAAEGFGWLDADARLTGEVNAIRRDGLSGWARDPVSTGRVVDQLWPDAGREIICLGGGGTAVALLTHLSRRAKLPSGALICETDPARAAGLRVFLDSLCPSFETEIRLGSGAATWDPVVAGASELALIVNATGLGKDRPGSPLSQGASFPSRSVVWELNYRGSLEFLRIARGSGASVHDGWSLFCHGWAAALTPILGLPEDPGLGEAFAEAVADLRP